MRLEIEPKENENINDNNINRAQIHENNNNDDEINRSNRFKYTSIRAAIMFFSFVTILLNVVYGFAMPHSNVNCIMDYTLFYTSGANNYFLQDQFSKFLLLVISSLFVDVIMIILGVIWIVYGKSWRLFVSLITFYIFKIIVQSVFQESSPQGNIIEYPGFPSIMISYLKTNDFFFSAPVGFLVIASLEFLKNGQNYLLISSVLICTLQIITRIMLRGNYIIDIFSAIILAHYIFCLADKYCPIYLDNSENEWLNLKDTEIIIEARIEKKGYEPINKDDHLN